MKFTIRLVGALWLAAPLVVVALERRAVLLGEGLREAIEPQVARGSTAGVERILKKLGKPQRGIAVYDRLASLLVGAPAPPPILPAAVPEVTEALTSGEAQRGFREFEGSRQYVYAAPLLRDDRPVGALLVVLDAGHLVTAEWELWH